MSRVDPLLKIGATLACFQLVGKILLLMHTLIIWVILFEMTHAMLFNIFALIPSRPVALLEYKELKNSETKFCEISGMSKLAPSGSLSEMYVVAQRIHDPRYS